jgi:hypothetical protein
MRFWSASVVVAFVLGSTSLAYAEGGSGIVVGRPGAADRMMSAAEVEAMPAVSVTLPADSGHGQGARTFAGPLLWTVLDHEGALERLDPHAQVRQVVVLAGQDGYIAVIALGEISPEFEGKQVILADRLDGKALAPGHFRIVVPGDKRGGRGVHDLVRIELEPVVLPAG